MKKLVNFATITAICCLFATACSNYEEVEIASSDGREELSGDSRVALPSNKIVGFWYQRNYNPNPGPFIDGWLVCAQYPVTSSIQFTTRNGESNYSSSLSPNPWSDYGSMFFEMTGSNFSANTSPRPITIGGRGITGNYFSDGAYNYTFEIRPYGQGNDIHWGHCNSYFRSDGSCACPTVALEIEALEGSGPNGQLTQSDCIALAQAIWADSTNTVYYYGAEGPYSNPVYNIATYIGANYNYPERLPVLQYRALGAFGSYGSYLNYYAWDNCIAYTYRYGPNLSISWSMHPVVEYPRPYEGF